MSTSIIISVVAVVLSIVSFFYTILKNRELKNLNVLEHKVNLISKLYSKISLVQQTLNEVNKKYPYGLINYSEFETQIDFTDSIHELASLDGYLATLSNLSISLDRNTHGWKIHEWKKMQLNVRKIEAELDVCISKVRNLIELPGENNHITSKPIDLHKAKKQ